MRFVAQLCTTKGAAWPVMQDTDRGISESAVLPLMKFRLTR